MLAQRVSAWEAGIRAAEPAEFWLLMALASLAALVALVAAFRFLRRKQIIDNTATSLIRSAAQGYVEFRGRSELLDGAPIIAPLTKKTCVWYEYQVQKRNHENEWKTVDEGRSGEMFALNDGSGRCIVDPDGADVTAGVTERWHAADYRYTEHRMDIGDPVYAIGYFKTVSGVLSHGDSGLEVRELIREWKQDHEALLARFDQNGDGSIDMSEWSRVREAAEQEVFRERAEHDRNGPVHILARPPERGYPYLLSNRSEHDLSRRYRWYCKGLIGVFLLCGTFLSWSMTARFFH